MILRINIKILTSTIQFIQTNAHKKTYTYLVSVFVVRNYKFGFISKSHKCVFDTTFFFLDIILKKLCFQ